MLFILSETQSYIKSSEIIENVKYSVDKLATGVILKLEVKGVDCRKRNTRVEKRKTDRKWKRFNCKRLVVKQGDPINLRLQINPSHRFMLIDAVLSSRFTKPGSSQSKSMATSGPAPRVIGFRLSSERCNRFSKLFQC